MRIGAEYGLLGYDLAIRKDVCLNIDVRGIIREIIVGCREDDCDLYFKNAVLLPTFINSHVHILDSIAREKAYGEDIFRSVVGKDSIKMRAIREATEDELVYAIRSAFNEMISRGITAVISYVEGGIWGIGLVKKALTGNERVIILGRPNGDEPSSIIKIADGFGLSSLNSYSDGELSLFESLAKEYKKLLSVHASETLVQRTKSSALSGKTDVMRALEFRFDLLIHLTYATESELTLLKKVGVLPVFCPRANMYLGLAFPPISYAVKIGLEFAIGTDNIMLNMPDFFREFDLIVRLTRNQGVVIDPKILLKAATTVPAKYLGLRYGIIKENNYADFMIFDLSKPNVCCVSDIYKAIVLRGEPPNIKAVFVSGKKVFERS